MNLLENERILWFNIYTYKYILKELISMIKFIFSFILSMLRFHFYSLFY